MQNISVTSHNTGQDSNCEAFWRQEGLGTCPEYCTLCSKCVSSPEERDPANVPSSASIKSSAKAAVAFLYQKWDLGSNSEQTRDTYFAYCE